MPALEVCWTRRDDPLSIRAARTAAVAERRKRRHSLVAHKKRVLSSVLQPSVQIGRILRERGVAAP